MSWPWSELGLEGPAELPEIRRAYAQRLKTTHPEEDPEGFQRLHDAYQEASRQARRRRRAQAGETPPEPATDPCAAREDGRREAPAEKPEAVSARRQAPPEESGERPEEDEEPVGPGTPESSEKTADWDYDRLFAEGEEEAREARRKHLEELREKNRARYAAQEAEQRKRAGDEEEAWAAVMAATQALELLHSTGASHAEWMRFLNGPVFWSAKANLDFVFALEDFLEQNPDLPKEIRQAVFVSYGFEKGPGKPEYKRLYTLLNVGRREKGRLRRENSAWRRQWRSWPRRRRVATVLGLTWLALLAVVGFWDPMAGAVKSVGALLFSGGPAWEETAVEWLEEDFGRSFIHVENEEDSHIFAPADTPDMLFFAYRSDAEERDPERGEAGYVTNYPDRMVMKAMEEFAQDSGLALGFDSAGGGFHNRPGETPGAYLLQMPLDGAAEAVTRLGELLAELRQRDWYQKLPPDFEVFLCYGDLSFYKVRSTEGEFDADYARSLYENKFGPEMCRYIAEHSGAAARDMGEDAYVLLEEGRVSIGEETFFWVSGREKPPSNGVLAHYFLSVDGKELFVLPPELLEGGFTLEELRGEPRQVQIIPELKDRAAVTVRDLVK